MIAASKKEEILVDPSMAEALTVRQGLQLAANLKLGCVLIQSDALMVVGCVNSISYSTVLEPIILDCIMFLSGFQGKFSYLC